jgi:dTDP-4-amino-4,6-dideoxygalactose transaminase
MINFNKPVLIGDEITYLLDSINQGHLSGDGKYTKLCSEWIEKRLNVKKALLTHSCTGALEMAALLIDIKPGDEIIMPSFTFVSTANAFVLRGGVPVFVDIDRVTLNIDYSLIESSITSKTKAIVVVHYAGVVCDMERILEISKKYNLFVIEDAAQALLSKFNNQYAGTFGHLSCFSFHETKNIISGEGGALIINDDNLIERAEIIREKGTNRSNFFRGQVDKYTWVDIGSSYLPSELIAAFLYGQLLNSDKIISQRKEIWQYYNENIVGNRIVKPFLPIICDQNYHIFYLIFDSNSIREEFIAELKLHQISAVFHYIPLHSSPAGIKFGKTYDKQLPNTDFISDALVRIPIWIGVDYVRVTNTINEILKSL